MVVNGREIGAMKRSSWILAVLILGLGAWAGADDRGVPPENDLGVREYDELVLKVKPSNVLQGFFRRTAEGGLERNQSGKLIFRIEVGETKGITHFVTDEEIYAMRFVQTEEQVFRKRLKKELKPHRIHIPSYKRKAEEAIKLGFEDIAEDLYREVVRLDATHLEGYMLLGGLLRKRFKFDEEMRLYRKGLGEAVVNKEHLLTRLATLLKKIGLPEAAEAEFLKALDENPKHVEALLEYGGLLVAMRRYARAREQLKIAVQNAYAGEEKGRCQVAYGDVLLKLGDIDGAKKQFEDAAFNLTEDPGVKVSLGSVLYLKGETARAKEIFMEVLGIEVIGPGGGESEGEEPGEGEIPGGEEEGADGSDEEGEGEEESGDGEEGGGEPEEDEEVFTEFSPFKSNVYTNLALCLIRDADFENALHYLEQAAGIDPTSARPWSVQGYLRERQGDADGALEAYRTGVEIDPSSSYCHYAIGQILLGREEFDEAAQSFQRAVEHNHVFSDAYYKLGVIAIRQDRGADAVRFLEHALALAPGQTRRKISLGVAHLMLRQHREAERYFREVLTEDATNLLAHIGETYLLYYKPKWEKKALEKLEILLEDTENMPEKLKEYLGKIIGLIKENMGKAQWIDDFDRPNAFSVGRKWEEKKRFGVTVRLQDSRVLFTGEQKTAGETVMETPRVASEFVRFEIDLRISSYEAFGAGIRLAHRMKGRTRREDIRAGLFFGRSEKNQLVFGVWDPNFKRWKEEKVIGEWPVGEDGETKTNRLGIEFARHTEGKAETLRINFLLDGEPLVTGFEHDRFKRKISSGDFWVGVYASANHGQKVEFTADNASIVIWKE
jgi:tetratricopeptide (TPR) repeat protein